MEQNKKKPIKKPDIDTSVYYKPLTDDFDPTTTLRADKWDTMGLQDLWHQKILLQEKINYCNSIGQMQMVQQMENGMKRLHARIEEKSVEEGYDDTIKFRW